MHLCPEAQAKQALPLRPQATSLTASTHSPEPVQQLWQFPEPQGGFGGEQPRAVTRSVAKTKTRTQEGFVASPQYRYFLPASKPSA